jgi:hypothetical protein
MAMVLPLEAVPVRIASLRTSYPSPGLDPGIVDIHVFSCCVSARKGVDGRDKPGHDDVETGICLVGVTLEPVAAIAAILVATVSP